MPPELEAIQNEIKGIEQNLMPLLKQQSEEIKAHGETAKATRDAIKTLEAKYDERLQDLDGVREQLAEIKKDLGDQSLPGGRKRDDVALTPGQAFVGSEAYKTLSEARPESEGVAVKSFFAGRKALFTDASLGTGDIHLYPAHREAGIIDGPFPDLHIRDLLTVTAIDEALVHYIERTNGRWVGEIQESEGDLKKEQTLNLTARQAAAVTIAHWLPISKQALRRAPQLRQYIDNELVLGLRLAEDIQLLYGDGSSGNLQGLMTNNNVIDYGTSGRAQGGDTRIDTIRRALTLLRLNYYRGSGLVVHPNDWEAIELQKDDQKRYLWVTVTDGGVPRLWRVPVVDTPAINEDEFLVGDFLMGANLWDVERATVSTGYHNDDFVRNQLVILGEEDIAFTTEHPKAFVKGDFGAVSS